MGAKRARPKQAHHRGDFDRRAKAVRLAAYANPDTRCWRCGRTLAQHPRTRTGKPPTWEAGHLRDGDPSSPLAPEAITCNRAAAARKVNARKKKTPLHLTRYW